MNEKFKKGIYEPINKEKYRGRRYPIYRSQWELYLMQRLDKSKYVIEWVCEPYPIIYMNPVKGRPTRYYPDFLVTYLDVNGVKHQDMIEVKPFKQTVPPVNTGKKRKSTLLIENYNWVINNAKWEAARKYCASRGINFVLYTEREIFGVKKFS